jgi:hypothetical protein
MYNKFAVYNYKCQLHIFRFSVFSCSGNQVFNVRFVYSYTIPEEDVGVEINIEK